MQKGAVIAAITAIVGVNALMFFGPRRDNEAGTDVGECHLEEIVSELGGPRAKDCGRIKPQGAMTLANLGEPGACAVKAFEAGQPFRLIVDRPGLGTSIAQAWVQTSTGTLYVLNYDSGDVHGGIGIQGAQGQGLVTAVPCCWPEVDEDQKWLRCRPTPSGELGSWVLCPKRQPLPECPSQGRGQ